MIVDTVLSERNAAMSSIGHTDIVHRAQREEHYATNALFAFRSGRLGWPGDIHSTE